MKADMNALPETYRKGAPSFWVRMEVQPEGKLTPMYLAGNHFYQDDSFRNIIPPYAVGDTLYLREEWRVESTHGAFDSFYIWVEYESGGLARRIDLSSTEYGDMITLKTPYWQPASTMPEWASDKNKRVTVTGVEAKRCAELRMGDMGFEPELQNVMGCPEDMGIVGRFMDVVGSDVYERNDWGWYVTLEDVT